VSRVIGPVPLFVQIDDRMERGNRSGVLRAEGRLERVVSLEDQGLGFREATQ
jgi:hypothetical protein